MSSADSDARTAALQQMDNGAVATARPVLVRLANTYRCDLSLQAAAGMALAQSGAEKEALPYLQKAHSGKPADAAIAYNLGVTQLKAGDAVGAQATFRGMLARMPGRSDIRLALASAQLQANDYAAAANSFADAEKALRSSGEQLPPETRQDWAVALLNAGRAAEAKKVLLQIHELQQSAPALSLLAEAEEKSGNYKEALEHYEAAAKLDPSEANVYAFGNELLQHWTFPPAIDVFKFGAAKYPVSDRMQLALGIAYFGNGNYDKAIPVFETLLRNSPANTAAADLLGRSCAATSGDSAPGCSTLQTFAEQHPENATASVYAASAILREPGTTRDLARARALLEQAVKSDPKLPDAWYQMGVLQQAENQWEPSAASLQRAIDLRPAFPEAHYRLSRALGHMGKREQATAEIALQRQYTEQEKQANNQRMKDVITFLTTQ